MIQNPRLIQLQEWKPTELALSAEELAELQAIPAKLLIQPTGGQYVVTPRSIVGSATTTRLHVVIKPKLSIDRVFFLLGYARKIRFAADTTTLAAREGIVEPFVAAFLNALQRALRRGLWMSYVSREEALPTIRGRVRFQDQLRRRYNFPLPVEIGYDDYTIDTQANRLVKAALRRIERLQLPQREAAQTNGGVTRRIHWRCRCRLRRRASRLQLHEARRRGTGPFSSSPPLVVRNTSVELFQALRPRVRSCST